MSLDSLVDDKTERLTTVPDALFRRTIRIQKKLFVETLALLNELDLTNGFISRTKANLTRNRIIVRKIATNLQKLGYNKSVGAFAKEFNEQAKLTKEVFEESIGEFKPSPLTSELLEVSKTKTVAALVGDSLNVPFNKPILDQLDSSVSSGASFTDTVAAISLLILGTDELDSLLLRHNKQIATDSFAIADREFTVNVANDLSVEWYLYTGGLISDSRDFCSARDGKYYHKTEVESWVTTTPGAGNPIPHGKNWQGRRKTTDKRTIFNYCGGWKCKHSLIPVSIAIVPKGVIERNIASGNFTPSPLEIEEFNLST